MLNTKESILDHVGIVVPTLDDGIPIWEAIVGTPAEGREIVPSQNVEVIFVGSGVGRVELLAPTTAESPIATFLTRRGPGIHHLCYRVPDIRAALADFQARGFQAIDTEPRPGAHGHQVAFLHPRAAGGVLVELLEAAGHR